MHHYIVKQTRLIGQSTLLLTLQVKAGEQALEFYPGQYAAIGYKRLRRPSPMRCFSIVSSPNQPDELQFATRIYGNFTPALARLKPGDTVFVHGPFGNFVIDERYDERAVLLAAGIGITPFMSMIRTATESRWTIPITLLYTNRSQENIPFYEELRELQRRNPNFRVVFFVTKGGIDRLTGARVIAGRIDKTHLSQLTKDHYNRFTYFICGPKGFTKGLQATLLARETDPGRIITEEFTPSSQVKAISAAPKYSISRWTYGLTGASLLLGTAFIMTLDLARAVPKLISTQAAQSPTTSQSQNAGLAGSSTSSGSSSNSTPSYSTGSSSTGSSATNQQSSSATTTTPTTTQSTQTYQSPTTSVS